MNSLPALPSPQASTSRLPSSETATLTAESLSFFPHPKPFKNPHYSRTETGQIASKRNKSLKQILVLERERVDRILEGKKSAVLEEFGEGAEEGEGEDGERRRKREVELMRVFEGVVSYASVEAPPSLKPQKKYCDVTGLEAKYVDPKSTLRYHNPEIYQVVKGFQPAVIQAYLAVRGQGVVLR